MTATVGGMHNLHVTEECEVYICMKQTNPLAMQCKFPGQKKKDSVLIRSENSME